MKRAVLFIMLFSILLTACSDSAVDTSGDVDESVATESTVSQEVSEGEKWGEFETVLRFIVTSDNHVSTPASETAQRLKKLFASSYKYADAQTYNKIDAFVAVGDLTNNGSAGECNAWKAVVNASIRPETKIITVAGNHEYYHDGTNDGYIKAIDSELDKHIVINGYHFIGISSVKEGDYTNSVKWLKEELKKASEDGKEKPIFTFQHHHIKDTVYTSPTWNTVNSPMLDMLYSDYSQVINFSGHSHAPINNPASVYQKDYTLFGTGTLYYFEMAPGMTYGTIPPDSDKAAQFYIVEVARDNRVRVLPYNLLTDDFFKTPDGSKQIIYTIDDVNDKSTWLYTDGRLETTAAPKFSDDAMITFGKVTYNTAEITFTQATDDDCVYSYNIKLRSADGSVLEYNYYSEYYFEPMPKTLSFKLSKLKPDTEYDVEIYPIDVFKKVGEPIKSTVKTEPLSSSEYESVNDVNFLGTFTNFDSHDKLTVSSGCYSYSDSFNGDIFVGAWNSNSTDTESFFELTPDGGYNNSKALALWSTGRVNQACYLFGTNENKNTVSYPSTKYLRVWVDFTDVEFRKANFGLVAPNGDLYSTDESDYVADLEYYCLAEGETEWKKYVHGSDGCFGVAQDTPVKGFKGWMAFPVEDFTYRAGTGKGEGVQGEAYPYAEIAAVYFYWNYSEDTQSGKKVILDELALVDDYTSFIEYTK